MHYDRGWSATLFVRPKGEQRECGDAYELGNQNELEATGRCDEGHAKLVPGWCGEQGRELLSLLVDLNHNRYGLLFGFFR